MLFLGSILGNLFFIYIYIYIYILYTYGSVIEKQIHVGYGANHTQTQKICFFENEILGAIWDCWWWYFSAYRTLLIFKQLNQNPQLTIQFSHSLLLWLAGQEQEPIQFFPTLSRRTVSDS